MRWGFNSLFEMHYVPGFRNHLIYALLFQFSI